MKKLLVTLMLALPLSVGTAFAQDKKAEPKKEEKKEMSAQQSKMGACNKDAEGKKGDERKAFMKECLSKDSGKKPTQQDKMKSCNKEATGKKGDERKAFMKDCLSK